MEKKSKHIKLQEIKLTITEWFDALRTPAPYKYKKKFSRKDKHKKTRLPE